MEFLRFACMSNCQSKKSIEQKPTRDECVFQSTDCNIEQLKLELNTVKTFTCLFTRLLFFACFPQYGQGNMSFWSLQNLNKWTKSHVLPQGMDFLITKLEQNLYFELLAGCWKPKHCKNCEICPLQVFWKIIKLSGRMCTHCRVDLSE